MNKLHHIQAFAKVVETGGFSSAARALGLSRSAVSKYVRQLEDVVEARLLHRSTRRVSPTDAGQAYYKRISPVLLELEAADRNVAELHEAPRGTLRVNAPMSFGTAFVGPIVADFMQEYRELRIELTLNDRFVDPIEEGYDVTVRIGDLVDSSLMSRRIAGTRQVLVASPEYIESYGAPARLQELRTRRCLHYGYLATGDRWRLEGPEGPQTVRISSVLCSNNGEVLRSAAMRGVGVALLPMFLVEEALQNGTLQPILPAYSAPCLNIYLIYPPGRRLSTKARLFGDFLANRLRGRTIWEEDPNELAANTVNRVDDAEPPIGEDNSEGGDMPPAPESADAIGGATGWEAPDPDGAGAEWLAKRAIAAEGGGSRVGDDGEPDSGGDMPDGIDREDG